MNSKQRIGLAIGGGIVAIAAAVGVGAMAANLAGSDAAAPGMSDYGPGQGGRMGQAGRLDTTTMATALAQKLGVDESAVKTALDNALQSGRPANGNGTPPSGAPTGAPPGTAPSGSPSDGVPGQGTQRTEMLTAMASSMATELNLDQSTVLTALQEVWAQYGPGANQPSVQPTS